MRRILLLSILGLIRACLSAVEFGQEPKSAPEEKKTRQSTRHSQALAAALVLAAMPVAAQAAFPAALAAIGPLIAKAGAGTTAAKAGGAAGIATTGAAGTDPAKAAESAEKAVEKRQERIEKQWDHVIKLNKDVKEGLIDQWKPGPASIKPQLETLEAVEKTISSPVPPSRAHTHLDGVALFSQPVPSLPTLPTAKESERPSPVIAAAPSAGARLREGAARPPVLLPTVSAKPPIQPSER
jgi:hypothetical protein